MDFSEKLELLMTSLQVWLYAKLASDRFARRFWPSALPGELPGCLQYKPHAQGASRNLVTTATMRLHIYFGYMHSFSRCLKPILITVLDQVLCYMYKSEEYLLSAALFEL